MPTGKRGVWARTRCAATWQCPFCRGSLKAGSFFPSTGTWRVTPRPCAWRPRSGRTSLRIGPSLRRLCGRPANIPGSFFRRRPSPGRSGAAFWRHKASPRSIGGRKVVNDVALRLQQGEIVGLLGPNGAGKTTTFYMIVGLIQPLAGRIRAGRRRHHDDADVQAGAAGDRLPFAGAVDLPQAVGRGQHPGDPRDARPARASERRGAARDAAGRAEHQAPAAQQGVRALGRRAAAPRDHAGAGHAAEVHDAGRAVRRRRPDRRARHPAASSPTSATAASAS